jgi:hypothetical protein
MSGGDSEQEMDGLIPPMTMPNTRYGKTATAQSPPTENNDIVTETETIATIPDGEVIYQDSHKLGTKTLLFQV